MSTTATAAAAEATLTKAAATNATVARHLKILIYGLSGAGKTQLALSATEVPAMRPVVVFDVERGLIGVNPSEHWKAIPIDSIEDAESAMGQIGRYKTVVIDSLTRLHRMSTTNFANARTQGRPNDEVRPEDYGKTLRRVGAILDYLQRQPINVIVIAGLKFTYTEDSTKANPKYRDLMPDLDGKVLDRAKDTADMFWPLIEQGEHRGLLTLPRSPYHVKSRRLLDMGPGKFVNAQGVAVDPTMTKIWQAFQDSFTAQ